jgi:hypothetical protein
MRIYVSHSGSYDYEKELYEPLKASELARSHHFFLPHETENISTAAKDELRQTDVLVAEVSLPSTGQGIELAQADAMAVPIICFFKAGSKPSGSLRFVANKAVEYNDMQDMLTKLGAELDRFATQSK